MKRLLALAVLALALSLPPVAARAQVQMNIQIGLPVAPPLVVVQPGVQVVEDYDEEVFFTNGWYWCRRPTGWYRARGPGAAFVFVQPRYVPARLVRLPPGQYRHWRRADHPEWREHERGERREWKAERREWKNEAKAERREWKEHGHGNGHGHGHDD